MNIALVTPQWLTTTGGPPRYVQGLRDTLVEGGHRATVVTTDKGPGAIELPSRPLRREAALFTTLRRLRPDVVHIHGRVHFIAPAVAYRSLSGSASVVFTFHTQPYIRAFLDGGMASGAPDYVGVRRRLASALLARCDAITTVSASIVENLNRFYALGLRHTLTIPSAGHPREPSADRVRALKERYGLAQSWPILSSVGVLSWDWKVAGHLASIRALGVLGERYPNARLLIAGDGQHRRILEAEVGRLALGDRVHFLGNVDHPEDVLAASDVYVHMAPHEGCSLAVIEAMYAARPIVASNEGGTPGILVHRESARLCDGDPHNVAAEIVALLEDPIQADALARRAQQDAVARYSWSSVTAQYDALYRRLHAGQRGMSTL